MGWWSLLPVLAIATLALSLLSPCACQRLNDGGKPGAVLSGGLRAIASNPRSIALLPNACLRKTRHTHNSVTTTASVEQAQEDYIRIMTAAKGGCKAAELANQLKQIGGEHVRHHARVVSAIVPMSAINQLNDLPCLHLAREEPVTTHQVNFQGARSMSVSRGLQQLSISGARKGREVRVGILSDSFNSLGGYCDDILSNALPGGIHVLSDLVPGKDSVSGTDEGRAMAQVVYSVAPGARLSFATGLRGQADFANNILALARPFKDDIVDDNNDNEDVDVDDYHACHVLVDDVKYHGEPMFQNGIVAQAVNDARKRYNVAYFSSAGNQGFNSYRSDFVPSGVTGKAGMLHAFGSAWNDTMPVVYQQYSFAPGFTTLVFQWDEPWFSVSGRFGAACKSDIDIRVSFDPSAPVQWLDGLDVNTGKDAIEFLQVLNNDVTAHVVGNISIEWVSGPQPGAIKYVALGSTGSGPLDFDTQSATCFGHANAGASVPVGAYAYFDSRAYGNGRPSRENFSAAVGTPTLFSDNGTRLVNPKVHKNLLMAPDGTDTTFLGVKDSNGNKQPQFVGTSAAAPHAAGVAALLIGASDAPLSPEAVVKAMQGTADDMDDPRTPWFDRKFDYATGFGAVNATRAAEYLSIVSCY